MPEEEVVLGGVIAHTHHNNHGGENMKLYTHIAIMLVVAALFTGCAVRPEDKEMITQAFGAGALRFAGVITVGCVGAMIGSLAGLFQAWRNKGSMTDALATTLLAAVGLPAMMVFMWGWFMNSSLFEVAPKAFSEISISGYFGYAITAVAAVAIAYAYVLGAAKRQPT